MIAMNEQHKNFLERLQSADEDVKKKWMIGVTAVVMVAVVYLWMGYFNGIVGGASQPASITPNSGAGGFTFWGTMQHGAALIYNAFTDKLHALGNILQTTSDITVKPQQ